jgi:sec-independent protein translocase protein TatA
MNILASGIGNLGGPDLFIVLLIVLVLFGAKKLPDLARSLGQSMNEFRKAREDIDRELHNAAAHPSGTATLPVHAASRSGAALMTGDAGSAARIGESSTKAQ